MVCHQTRYRGLVQTSGDRRSYPWKVERTGSAESPTRKLILKVPFSNYVREYADSGNTDVQRNYTTTSFPTALLNNVSLYKRERSRGVSLVQDDRPPRTRPKARIV